MVIFNEQVTASQYDPDLPRTSEVRINGIASANAVSEVRRGKLPTHVKNPLNNVEKDCINN